MKKEALPLPSFLLFFLFSPATNTHHPRSARNSKPIEVIGTYDPIPKPPADGEGRPYKDIRLDSARVKYWLGVGAQPSDPAWRLLSMVCEKLGMKCV
jgi:ribosomal protein S16